MVIRNSLEWYSNLCRIQFIGNTDFIYGLKYSPEFLLYDPLGPFHFFKLGGLRGLLNFDKGPKWYSETYQSGVKILVKSNLLVLVTFKFLKRVNFFFKPLLKEIILWVYNLSIWFTTIPLAVSFYDPSNRSGAFKISVTSPTILLK